MPKAFNEHEKAAIRAQLREQGERLFTTYGLKKTSVDDLTQATGISKGGFYLFYNSKEELMMEILEAMEVELQSSILDCAVDPGADARQQVHAILTNFLVKWESYPLLKQFTQEDYMLLVRKLPAERVQAHATRDEEFVNNFVTKLAQEGITMRATPRIVANLLKSLFFVSLHRDELGAAAYAETMTVLVDLVAGYITDGQA